MSTVEFEYRTGFPAVRLIHSNGLTSAEVLLYGGHVIAWTVNNQSLLFMRFEIDVYFIFT